MKNDFAGGASHHRCGVIAADEPGATLFDGGGRRGGSFCVAQRPSCAATGLDLFENEGLLELENVVLTIEHHSHAWRNGIAGDHQCAPHWQARVRRRY